MKNKIQSDPEYNEESKMLNVIRPLNIIERICLSNNNSKYYALQGYIAQKRLFNFRQVNGMPLTDYYNCEFEMLAKVAFKTGAEFVTMERLECEREKVYCITQQSFLNDNQKSILYNRIRERDMAIVFVMNSNHNKYGHFKEDCNNSYSHKNNQKWPKLSPKHNKLNDYKFDLDY